MPHVLIKHFPLSLSNDDKEKISSQISAIIATGFSCPENVVSISMQAIEKEDWDKEVYQPEIENRQDILIKKPIY